MSQESRSNRIYEQRIVIDSLARLVKRLDVGSLPLSGEELHNLAKRHRESVHGAERKLDRLTRYKAHLAKSHGADVIEAVSAALEEINNEIAWEEK